MSMDEMFPDELSFSAPRPVSREEYERLHAQVECLKKQVQHLTLSVQELTLSGVSLEATLKQLLVMMNNLGRCLIEKL